MTESHEVAMSTLPRGAARPAQRIAVVGSGIAGLSAAWLLARNHAVTLFEAAPTLGGHTNTVELEMDGIRVPVDTGFIVYNPPNYPNLVALFDHLRVPTAPSDMSFSVSLRGGALEYAGSDDPRSLFAQPANLLSPRFWRMLAGIFRFYRAAPGYLESPLADLSLGELLDRLGYPAAFCADHLLPMAGAIWSAGVADIRAFPARSFIRFFANHGLFRFTDRPPWRTVAGGSREYLLRLRDDMPGVDIVHQPVRRIVRAAEQARLSFGDNSTASFDQVVLAVHADQALALLDDPSPDERRLLGAFRYSVNQAFLHEDERLMPRRRRAWASWNYLEQTSPADAGGPCLTYWMNRLQPLATSRNLFVTLNPPETPARTHYATTYTHPQFDRAALAAQQSLWRLQGVRRTWFCGAHCGHGFHEDGLQSGLLVAEQLGGVARPWPLPTQPSRVPLAPATAALNTPLSADAA